MAQSKKTDRIALLNEKLEHAKSALLNMGDFEMPEDVDPLSKQAHILNVLDQAERSTLRERIFDLKALLAIEMGQDAAAIKFAKTATEASTQSTRALKQVQSDRLFVLEQEQQQREQRFSHLRAIK